MPDELSYFPADWKNHNAANPGNAPLEGALPSESAEEERIFSDSEINKFLARAAIGEEI